MLSNALTIKGESGSSAITRSSAPAGAEIGGKERSVQEIAKARSRSDITGEKVIYDREKRTRWTDSERQQLARELANYLKSPAAPKIPNGQKKKAAVVAKLPALSKKINLLGPRTGTRFARRRRRSPDDGMNVEGGRTELRRGRPPGSHMSQ